MNVPLRLSSVIGCDSVWRLALSSPPSHFRGEGRVFDSGELIATVQYDIRVSPVFIENNLLAGERSRTPNGVQIILKLSDLSAPIPLTAAKLTLALEDGRNLDFFKQSAYAFVPTGGFYETEQC